MTGQVVQGYFAAAGLGPQRGSGASAPARTAVAQARPTPLQLNTNRHCFPIDPLQVGLVRGGGTPLPQAVLAKMEAAFGADFSAVRVHVGPQASRIGAIAFTMGNDIYFAAGQYAPGTVQGQQLLGHELTHVVQQRQGRVRAPGAGISVVQDRGLEAEAEALGKKVATQHAPINARQALPYVSPGAVPLEAFGPARFRTVQAMMAAVPDNRAAEPGQATFLTATNMTTEVELCENLGSAGGAHAEDRFIDVTLPAAAAAGQLAAGVDNEIYVGINRSPCTSTDHLGNGSPSCNKAGAALGCAERLINLVTTGLNHAGTNYPIRLVLEVRNLYGSSDNERANSAVAIEAMVATTRIKCDMQRTANSQRFLNTGAAMQMA